MKPYILNETNWKTIKGQEYDIAVLPWGATEAHNYHMPYGTDTIQAEYIAAKAAAGAWTKGAKVMVLPCVPFGVNTTQLDIPFTINMNPSTQMAVLEDVVSSLAAHNINKIVIMNSHGGNDFEQMIRELFAVFPDVFICQLNWYKAVDFKKYFTDTGEHAGEMETSVMMVVDPSLILPLSEAGDGKSKTLSFKGAKEGWVWSPRPWSTVTKDTGIGNQALSTKEKGEKYLAEVIGKITDFFVELAKTEPEDFYK